MNTRKSIYSLCYLHMYYQENGEGELAEFISRWEGKVELIQKVIAGNEIADEILAIGKSGDYGLIIVGKDSCHYSMVAAPVAEQPELGHIGELLASSDQGIRSSVLVVQKLVDDDGEKGRYQERISSVV